MSRVFPSLIKGVCVLCASAAFIIFPNSAHALAYEDYPVVKLRSLDKITARTMTFEAKVGSTVRFGEIFIKVQSCRKPPPIEKSEAAAFLQIWQSKDIADQNKDASKWIFSGWMFASSPAVSAMDHSVYDVWVLDCLGRDPEPIPKTDENTGVQAPPTDGEAPNAVPPAVEPDKQKPVDPATGDVTPQDDPGAFDDAPANPEANPAAAPAPADTSAPDETVPTTNMPADAVPNPDSGAAYTPSHDAPDAYQDDTPADDTAPKDDTNIAPQIVPTPAPEPEKPKQEIEGIY